MNGQIRYPSLLAASHLSLDHLQKEKQEIDQQPTTLISDIGRRFSIELDEREHVTTKMHETSKQTGVTME